MVRRGSAGRFFALVVAAGALTLGGSALGTPPTTSRAIAAFFPSLAPTTPAPPAAKPARPAAPRAAAPSLDAPTTTSPRGTQVAARAEVKASAPGATGAACGKHFLAPFDGPLNLRTAYRSAGGPTRYCPQHSGFGPVRGGRNHWGVDISSPTGTSVRSAVDGTLTYAREPGYGLHARVRFATSTRGKSGACGGSEDYELIYAHLIDDGKTSTATRTVRAGEMIGRVGCSGNARGMCSPSPESHLHVTVQKYSTRTKVEPGSFLGWHLGVPTDRPADWEPCNGRR